MAMQPELFRDLEGEAQLKRGHPPLFPHQYLRVRVAYEDLIFSGLSLVLILLAGFCMGVERGKRLSGNPVQEIPAASAQMKPVNLPVGPIAQVSVEPQRPLRAVVAGSGKELGGGSYVIQLASYFDARAAEEESQRLRRQRFDARVVKQGKYFELRVVGYRARAEALNALPALKRTYQDGFIKRVSSG
ncbi:MAG: SPOR domain-containing protein [Candidatus Omnitrophica bacterium]|nr:SPOR domain-containing protein [Candidatus Omnitrophota bacterium]